MLTVADPQQVYFFNYNPTTSHMHFLIDYEVTIPMRGGTTLTFEVNGGEIGARRPRLIQSRAARRPRVLSQRLSPTMASSCNSTSSL